MSSMGKLVMSQMTVNGNVVNESEMNIWLPVVLVENLAERCPSPSAGMSSSSYPSVFAVIVKSIMPLIDWPNIEARSTPSPVVLGVVLCCSEASIRVCSEVGLMRSLPSRPYHFRSIARTSLNCSSRLVSLSSIIWWKYCRKYCKKYSIVVK